MEEKIFPRYCSRRGPCAAARGGCGTLLCLSLLPCQSASCCCCRRRKQEQDLGPGSELTLFSSQHQPQETYGKALRCIPVAWGQLRSAGVVAPQHSHPSGHRDAVRNQKACILVDSPQGESKARQGKYLSACRARAQQPLFSWGWWVGGGAERNKQGFEMSSSPLKSHSLKHICVSRAVCSKNRLSLLLFSVLCVGHLYGSFFASSDQIIWCIMAQFSQSFIKKAAPNTS